MTGFPGSSSGRGSFQGDFHGSEVEEMSGLGSGISFDPAFVGEVGNGTGFETKGNRVTLNHGSQSVIPSTLQPTLNDLNPPMTSSQLQYSPTMSLKGGKATNKVNIMASPVQIKLSEPSALREDKGVKPSKTKKNGPGSGANGKNEMVFVNYSVQDTTDTQKKKKKQSKRDRMLRIFTGSNHSSGSSTASSVSSPNSCSTIVTDKPLTVRSAPASAIKRSYGSFLKCHRYSSNNSSGATVDTVEMVPKSEPIPNGQKPVLTRSASSTVALVRKNGRCSLSQSGQKFVKNEQLEKMDLLKYNIDKSGGSGSQSVVSQPNTLYSSKSHPNIDLRKAAGRNVDAKSTSNNASSVSASASASASSSSSASFHIGPTGRSQNKSYAPEQKENNDEDDFDHHYMEQYQESDHLSSAPSLQQSNASEDTLSTYFTDENDASVAFGKLFTRKRTNTGGSISSLLSLSATQPAVPALDRHQSCNSLASSLRYSPIRSGSQSRTRSSTRTSNHNRLSRDLTGLQLSMKISNTESGEMPGMESFLDSQPKGNKLMHKKKQESISDMARLQATQGPIMHYVSANSCTSMSSSASTPGTTDSALINFSKQSSFVVQRESSTDTEMIDEDGRIYFRPVIREDEECDSGMNSSGSGSHIGASSSSTVSTRQPASGLAYSNPNAYHMPTVSGTTREELQQPFSQSNSSNEMGIQNKQNSVEHNNELFNNYMDFNMEESAPSQLFNENGNLLHQLFNGPYNDTSTITSGMNVSPITVTAGNTSQDEVSTLAPSSQQKSSANLSFQSRIMNDIDRLAHGFNMSDLSYEQ